MPDLVREGLYIGDIHDAVDILRHGSDKITHILSILNDTSISYLTKFGQPDQPAIPSGDVQEARAENAAYQMEKAGKDLKFVRMSVRLEDSNKSSILDYLNVCANFIDKGRRNGGVLVHCHAGVSRSATVVAAYLVRSERLSAADAIASLKESRAVVNPIDGFVKQLEEFEVRCKRFFRSLFLS